MKQFCKYQRAKVIKNSKQQWEVGQSVKVGFLTLTVMEKVPTPGDYLPDAYILARNGVYYNFVPHNGLTRLDDYVHAA
jgi:hypothetical protein